MKKRIKLGIIGDYDETSDSHLATGSAIQHSSAYLSAEADVAWLPTESFLTQEGRKKLDEFDAYWASPGDPENPAGMETAIRIARETDKPFFGN